MSQLVGTVIGVSIALSGGFVVYGVMKKLVGIRLSKEEEYEGADLSIHKIASEADASILVYCYKKGVSI